MTVSDDLYNFVFPHRYANYASRGRFKIYPHIDFIGRKVYRAATTPGSRLMVNLPPRHNKSFLISYWTPTWFLDTFPEKQLLLSSYSAELASSWGRRVRNEMETNPVVRNRLSTDSKAANRFNTVAGGGMYTAGIDGGITGFGAHLMLIDDPHKSMAEAYSKRVRQQAYEWYQEAYSRLEPGGSIVILMQRMHPDDLCGMILKEAKDQWEVVCLPAVAEADDPMGRAIGDPLCAERYDRAALDRIRRSVGAEGWAARYQQAPRLLNARSVYREFNEANVRNVDIVPNLPLHLSMDFNVNPGMHCLIGQHHPHDDTFTAVHEIHEPRMSARDAMDAFDALVKRLGGFVWPELQVFGDASGGNRSLGTGETCYDIVRQKLNKMGMSQMGASGGNGKQYRIRVPKQNPRIFDRVNVVNDILCDMDGKRRYLIHSRCERLLTDLREMKTGDDGLPDKADQDLSHAVDAEGYRLHYIRPRLAVVESPQAYYGAMR